MPYTLQANEPFTFSARGTGETSWTPYRMHCEPLMYPSSSARLVVVIRSRILITVVWCIHVGRAPVLYKALSDGMDMRIRIHVYAYTYTYARAYTYACAYAYTYRMDMRTHVCTLVRQGTHALQRSQISMR